MHSLAGILPHNHLHETNPCPARAMAVVRSTGKSGSGTITVASPSLSKILEIKCSQCPLPEDTEKRPSIPQ